MIKRMRICRITRETVEVVVDVQQPLQRYDHLYDVAASVVIPEKQIEYDACHQYGFVPEGDIDVVYCK